MPQIPRKRKTQLDSLFKNLQKIDRYSDQSLTQELRETVLDNPDTERASLRGRSFAPHCDQSVLHPPGQCIYCDRYPEWQVARETWRINFTGYDDPDKAPCPSERRRDINSINRWGGNVERSY